MNLPYASATLSRLTQYLVREHKMMPSLLRMRVQWSPEEDRRNAQDPRGFCHVTSGAWFIYCSQQIEAVTPNVRCGLLLHEIGHLYIPAMSSDKSEVDVDEWILNEVPEAGYGYLPEYRYTRAGGGLVTARNIQSVSTEFVYRLR
jgi:hypothetical protein